MLCLFIPYDVLPQYFFFIWCIFVIENIYFANTANECTAVMSGYNLQDPSAKNEEQLSK